MTKWMHCFHLIVRYAVLSNSAVLFLECVHYRLNWPEKVYSASFYRTARCHFNGTYEYITDIKFATVREYGRQHNGVKLIAPHDATKKEMFIHLRQHFLLYGVILQHIEQRSRNEMLRVIALLCIQNY